MHDARTLRGTRALPVIAIVFLALGLLGGCAAAVLAWAESRSGRDLTTDGEIVGFAAGGRVPLPRIEFRPAAGPPAIRFVSPSGSSTFHLGDHLPVAYAPDRPQDARIDGFLGRWLLAGLAAGLGAAFLATAGILWLVWRIRTARRLVA